MPLSWWLRRSRSKTQAATRSAARLRLRVSGLPSGVTLANATGSYEGGSYRDVLAALQPLAPGKSVTVTLDFSMSGRRSPRLSKLDEDLEALLGI